MKRIVVAIPHSHTWFWTQTCIASLIRNPPNAKDCLVAVCVVNNSPWSPSIKGALALMPPKYKSNVMFWVEDNHKSNKFHASALDCVVERCNFDYLMALETDVMALKPGWLQWFIDQMRPTNYAVGMWHHEQFVNPSCTLYRGDVLREMNDWCKSHPDPDVLRWGEDFSKSQPIELRQPERDYRDWFDQNVSWIQGPFAEKRGFPQGTVMKEQPSGQMKGPGWYEPGQQLHHWATNHGYSYTICPTMTTKRSDSLPLQTLYGSTMPDPERQLEAVELFGNAYTAHLWGGTRALDILKHEVTCQFVKANTPMWLAREARFWKQTVPEEIQERTLELIRKYGWHTTGQGNSIPGGSERDRKAVEYIRECYKAGGVEW